MLPHNNNYYSYQGLPNRGNYTFDLKVNVDFNNGKVNLGVPVPTPPFTKKPDVPVIYPEQVFVPTPTPYQSGYSANYQPTPPPIYQPPQVWQPVQNYVRTQPAYNSTYNPQQIEQSYYMRYSDKPKARSTNDTYPDTSFSLPIEKSIDAVECVICDKSISREHFHDHLEEHKGRKRDYGRKETKPANETDKLGSFSVKNQNSLENVAQLYRENPSRGSHGRQSVQMGLSHLQQSKNGSRSREVQDTHSRIVYAPRDPSQIISASKSSQFAYSQSFGSEHPQPLQNPRTSHPSNEPVMSMQQNYQQGHNSNNSRTNKVSSMNLIASQVSSRRQDSRSLSHSKQPVQSYYQQNSRSSSMARGRPQDYMTQGSNNYSNMDRTESRIINSVSKKQPSFEDIQQSVIHRINDVSRDYSILQLKKQLNISQIEEQSSSDEGGYLSHRANPPTNIYQSISRSKQSVGLSSSSNNTQKLIRSKLPVNYLAREDFIVNSMLSRSCYKSKHTNWK